MLRRNPLAALALHRPTRAPEGSTMPALMEDGASPRPGRPHRTSSMNRPEGASDDEDAEARTRLPHSLPTAQVSFDVDANAHT